MNQKATHQTKFLLSFTIILMVFGADTVLGEPKTDPPHLVYIQADPQSVEYAALAECEKLTIAEYQKQGVRVTEKKAVDVDEWLEVEGKAYEKYQSGFQFLAYAKSLKADAIGGLDSRQYENKSPFIEGKTITTFEPWGFAIKGLCQADSPGEMGTSGRAIPLRLGGQNSDPWDIPMRVAPRLPSADKVVMNSWRPKKAFLGVRLVGQEISMIVPKSPAEAVGLQAGDKLIKINGTEVSDGSLPTIMGERKPGDEVEIEFSHGDVVTTKKITLAEANEVMDAARPKQGQPIPNLVGKDMEGREVKLSQFRGKVVLLDFWATWCGPCIQELPLVNEVAEALKGKDFVWVAVSADDDDRKWKDFVRDNSLAGVHLRNREWGTTLSVQDYPTLMLIDRDGILRDEAVFGDWLASEVFALLDEKK